jgi:hypothetical protein
MPFKDPEKRREAVRKSCKKAYWADPEKGRAKALATLSANRVRYRENARNRRLDNPEATRAATRKWNREHPESRALTRRRCMLKKRGLTIADYDRLHSAQGGLCAICRKPETSVKCGKVQLLTVEHCHVTGRFRGLTCNRCNRAMGLFDDDPALLRAAADYLSG